MRLSLFDAFKGKEFSLCADQIQLVAHQNYHTVGIIDPSNGMSSNIDVEPDRLDVHLDAEGRVVKFTVG